MDVIGMYNSIINVTSELVGRKVVRVNNVEKEPPVGTIVAAGIMSGGRLWVVWPHTNGEPTPHHPRELLAVKEMDPIMKGLKWSGKTIGSLKKFLEQVRVEGGGDDTVLNPKNEQHVAISIDLPLANDDRVAWSEPTEVDRTREGRMD